MRCELTAEDPEKTPKWLPFAYLVHNFAPIHAMTKLWHHCIELEKYIVLNFHFCGCGENGHEKRAETSNIKTFILIEKG